jgi:superfamily I DNA/RNA helicase
VAHAQDLQRERCLLFVALTRARDHLYISYSGSPSTFLRLKINTDYPERSRALPIKQMAFTRLASE